MLRDVRDFSHSQEKVYFRQLLSKILPYRCGRHPVTTRRLQELPYPFFPFGYPQDFVDGLFFCGEDKGTGVDKDDIRLVCLRGDVIAALRDECGHNLGIDQIFRAAEADDVYLI